MERNLFHLLNQKVRSFSKELNDHLQQHDLYTSQWTILYLLSKKGTMTQTEIWQYLQVEAPTVTRTLTRMEKNGWLSRNAGHDKRERIIMLTEQAKVKFPRIEQSVKSFENNFVTNLTTNEEQELYHLLEKLGTERRISTDENESKTSHMD